MGVSALELRRRVLMAQPHKERKTGGIVSFKTHVPQVLGVAVPLSPVQAGTGDPSPENIRPITGHTGAAVWDDPKHGGLIKWNQLNALNAPNALTTINEDGSVTITAPESTKTSYGHVSMLAETPFLSDHVYMLYTPGFFNDNGIRFYTARGSSDAIVAGNEARFFKNLAQSQTFVRSQIPAHEGTISATTFVMLFDLTEMFGAEVADGIYSSPYETALSWFKSLFFKAWYPFNAGEITCVSAVNGGTYRHQAFTFPETVYGCRIDWGRRVAVVEYEIKSVRDFGTWYAFEAGGFKGLRTRYTPLNANKSALMCSHYQAAVQSTLNPGKIVAGSWYYNLALCDPDHFITQAELFAYADAQAQAGQPIQIGVPLAEPVEIPLSTAEIRALMGENNVFVDAGDVEVEFWTN